MSAFKSIKFHQDHETAVLCLSLDKYFKTARAFICEVAQAHLLQVSGFVSNHSILEYQARQINKVIAGHCRLVRAFYTKPEVIVEGDVQQQHIPGYALVLQRSCGMITPDPNVCPDLIAKTSEQGSKNLQVGQLVCLTQRNLTAGGTVPSSRLEQVHRHNTYFALRGAC